jgi:transposase
MTYYAGLDISMKTTSIAIMNQEGKVVFESVCETDAESIAKTLINSNYKLEKIGLEAGCLSFWLMDELKNLNFHAICIETKEMATLIALKVNKTDRNDARLIANAMRCNLYKEVYHKTRDAIDISIQMGIRRTLVNVRTTLKNSIRGHLKVYGVRLGTVSHDRFSEKVKESIMGCEEGVYTVIEALLKTYEEACKNVKNVDIAIEKLCKDPLITLFKSIPGVGPITALTFKAVIGDPYRFQNPRNIGAYLGLTPNQYSSGDITKQGRISKCGCSELRMLLVECATSILTHTKGWTKLKAWGLKIERRNGHKKAAAAVARKLAIIMLRMWQEGKPFVHGEKKIKTKKEALTAA